MSEQYFETRLFGEPQEEERMIIGGVRALADNVLGPIAKEAERISELSEDLFFRFWRGKEFKDFGLFAIGIPELYGGTKVFLDVFAKIVEEICRVEAGLGLSLFASISLAAHPIALWGPSELKRKWLPAMALGKAIGCYCQTTDESGSDVASIDTKAVKRGQVWYISGAKSFITNANTAQVAIVLAVTDPTARISRRFTMFVVDMERAKSIGQVVIDRIEHKAGLHLSPLAHLTFLECEVDGILGEVGDGWKVAMATLAGSRAATIASQGIGIAQAAYDLARAYSQERLQFGRTLESMDVIREKLSDMEAMIAMARLLTRRACLLREQVEEQWRSGDFRKDSRAYEAQASMAKLVASRCAEYVPFEAQQIFGGFGYLIESGIPKLVADGRAIGIYEGTSEIQQLIIARSIVELLLTRPEDHEKSIRFNYLRPVLPKDLAKMLPDILLTRLTRLERSFMSALRTVWREVSWPHSDPRVIPAAWHELAEAYAFVEGARLLIWRQAWRNAHGEDIASMSRNEAVICHALRIAADKVSRVENRVRYHAKNQ